MCSRPRGGGALDWAGRRVVAGEGAGAGHDGGRWTRDRGRGARHLGAVYSGGAAVRAAAGSRLAWHGERPAGVVRRRAWRVASMRGRRAGRGAAACVGGGRLACVGGRWAGGRRACAAGTSCVAWAACVGGGGRHAWRGRRAWAAGGRRAWRGGDGVGGRGGHAWHGGGSASNGPSEREKGKRGRAVGLYKGLSRRDAWRGSLDAP
ncbi:uncharacterized protein [Miscanthus floridulus]|uniref:uncharacterized protein n=1 Tax=Miscanthus floridulus TaxID=154761 RepID=UPI0034593BA8